ncbi:rhodanese-like domain-containing protein [Candidatus Trichorickettsia mobilis]|uniref:rhodanese-like domain-containing protein n=1 Tax=Candidatus Trichorickettsia mobilis TaxID=1346319 RepID=UPI0029319489|nr:rhodanese-like domain-containing protein [Candidatus Trichorickettsia mobilis]
MTVRNLTSIEAYGLMQTTLGSMLIDVRTDKEWQENGVILNNKHNIILLLSWRILPDMVQNPSFVEEMSIKVNDYHTHLFFLCRSGVRSFEAANFITNHGYLNCYNIVDGFLGGEHGKGWKNNNLPWQVL